MNICIACNWADLADRYTQGAQPKVRPEVRDWQEDLAMEIRSSIVHLNIHLGPQVVVDIEVFFPDDGEDRDIVAYFPAFFQAVEMGTGVSAANFVPFVRSVQNVPEAETGFLLRLYSASFGGFNLQGTIIVLEGVKDTGTIITLDKALPAAWSGARVAINLGVITNE